MLRIFVFGLLFLSACGAGNLSRTSAITDIEPKHQDQDPVKQIVTIRVNDRLKNVFPQLTNENVQLEFLQHFPVGRTDFKLHINYGQHYVIPLELRLGEPILGRDHILVTVDKNGMYELKLFYARKIDQEVCTGTFPIFTCDEFDPSIFTSLGHDLGAKFDAAQIYLNNKEVLLIGTSDRQKHPEKVKDARLFLGASGFNLRTPPSKLEEHSIQTVFRIDLTDKKIYLDQTSVGQVVIDDNDSIEWFMIQITELCTGPWENVCTVRRNNNDEVAGVSLK